MYRVTVIVTLTVLGLTLRLLAAPDAPAGGLQTSSSGPTSSAEAGSEAGSELSVSAAFERAQESFRAAKTYQEEHPADGNSIRERYLEAAARYATAFEAGATSTEVLTNAANSYSFAGEIGKAVLFFRRALAIDPTNGIARDGLESLRAALPIRKPQASTGNSLLSTLFFWHEGLPFRTRLIAFFLLFPGSFLLFTIALWRRRPFLVIGIVLAIPASALLCSILVDALGGSLRRDGVIQVEVQGRRGDGETYGPSHSRPFPPGTELSILTEAKTSASSSASPWTQIRLLDGTQSWIPRAAMDPVLERVEE